jgi:hypothetical protein
MTLQITVLPPRNARHFEEQNAHSSRHFTLQDAMLLFSFIFVIPGKYHGKARKNVFGKLYLR